MRLPTNQRPAMGQASNVGHELSRGATLTTAVACSVELLIVGGMGRKTLAIKGISGGRVGCSKEKLLVALVLEEVVQSWRAVSSER